MRPFAPNQLGGLGDDFYAGLAEYRLKHSGEYARHVPPLPEVPQYVVVNYQHIPVSASAGGDYMLNGTNPKIWVYADHFAARPMLYREGNSAKPATGSLFEIRGFLYRVKKIDINHRGYMHCELERHDNCAVARPEFTIEVNALLCLPERPCADT